MVGICSDYINCGSRKQGAGRLEDWFRYCPVVARKSRVEAELQVGKGALNCSNPSHRNSAFGHRWMKR